MKKISKISSMLVSVSALALLSTAAMASGHGDDHHKKESCDMKKDHKKSCMMKKHHKSNGGCSLKSKANSSAKHVMNSIERLDLTADQRKEIKAIKDKYHALMPKLSDAFTKNSLDTKKLNEALNFNVESIQEKIITQSYGVLNDIQKEYLKKMLDKKTNHKKGSYHKNSDKKHCEMR